MSTRQINLRGVEVNNLRGVDLDIPHQQLIVFCGVSGSGKTSLALDTLYAEGQRRYIESFSAYTRQFLEQLERPTAEQISGLPPAIAVTHNQTVRSNRSTVATATDIADHLQLLFAKIGRIFCQGCGNEVRRSTSQSVAETLSGLRAGLRFMISFERSIAPQEDLDVLATSLKEDGFLRVIAKGRIIHLAQESLSSVFSESTEEIEHILVLVDRLTIGSTSDRRLTDSLETAFSNGNECCQIFVRADSIDLEPDGIIRKHRSVEYLLEDQIWQLLQFSSRLSCLVCNIEYSVPRPQLFSFNNALGACPGCEGFGRIDELDPRLIVPDTTKSIREGAIAPWNTPAYAHELEELLALAEDYQLPVDVPYAELTDKQLAIILHGVPERDFGGLDGFFSWLEKRKYKTHLRVFLARWKIYRSCSSCQGMRLRPEALAVKLGENNIAEVLEQKIGDAIDYIETLTLSESEKKLSKSMLEQIDSRLRYLESVGLNYLTLDRSLRTLSGGELQRVALTSALGSSLVNMLYVLDEPSVGLHPCDVQRLSRKILDLRNRRNTVVVVEHEEEMLRVADKIIEIGPEAGRNGGQIVFNGTPEEMLKKGASVTGDFLAGRRGFLTTKRREAKFGTVRLIGARGNNLKNLSVEFPLGLLCVVTGVSGAGKSTLIKQTLYGALCSKLKKESTPPLACEDVYGESQINDVLLVDQSPVGRSPRSNPVTYVKAFDEIRAVFADTIESKTHNYTASYFSFNVDGGRCTACKGDGYIEIDMQFMANVLMKCSQCRGTRYRKEILEAKYRGKNIAEVLEMTIREGLTFFRGKTKVQAKLKQLVDVGLDYLQLGQPLSTLSSGEAQRLKLASYMSGTKKRRVLFLLDEPTTGLHFSDIVKLLDCFSALIAVGHSLIVVEHNLQLIQAADHLIDLGPGAAEEGGRIVAQGTPEEIIQNENSLTGRYLADWTANRQ